MGITNVSTVRKPAQKDERLEARVTKDQKAMIERAAEIRGTSMTEFIISSVQLAAKATINEYEVLVLRDEARTEFVNALLNPPAPNAAARSAWRRYKENVVR